MNTHFFTKTFRGLLILALCIGLLLSLAACSPRTSVTPEEEPPDVGEALPEEVPEEPTEEGADPADCDLSLFSVEEALIDHLEANWGFRKDSDYLTYGDNEDIGGENCYVYDWYSGAEETKDQLLYRFAITPTLDTVYFYNENDGAWTEDVNP